MSQSGQNLRMARQTTIAELFGVSGGPTKAVRPSITNKREADREYDHSKCKRTFQNSWKEGRPWLTYDEDNQNPWLGYPLDNHIIFLISNAAYRPYCFHWDYIILTLNTIKSYKISQKLSPKHTARGVAQWYYPIYRHGKACLSKQSPWHAAGDSRLARSRSRVRAPAPAYFSTLPSFLLREIVFFTFPTNPMKVLGLLYTTCLV